MISIVAALVLASTAQAPEPYVLTQRTGEATAAFDQRIKDCAILSRAIVASLGDEDETNTAAAEEEARFDRLSKDLARQAQARATGALAQNGLMAELLRGRGLNLAKEQALYRGDAFRRRALDVFRQRWSAECVA